jgi:uncharacterized damage-inducible protein DinB
MNDGLIDAFGHNAWAMRGVLRVCGELTPAQMQATAPGTYGSISETFRHIVLSEARYYARLAGDQLPSERTGESPNLDEVSARVDELARKWDRYLAQPFDGERTLVVPFYDGHEYEVPAGVNLVQAIHHGNEHRARLCTRLSSLGGTPPALGLWNYAEATGRATPRQT